MKIEFKKLSEIATIDISSIDKKSKPSETPVKLCNFTDVYYNWAITREMESGFMSATASEQNISRFLLKKGQVAITKDSETRDDIGIPTYIADDFSDTVLGYHCALITPNEAIVDGAYLNAYLASRFGRKYFENQASGSGQRYTLTIEAIGSVGVYLPDIKTQQKIGKIFSTIDKKIKNNTAINTELESIAKTLYDYWFLQFEFPNEEGKPYKSSGGKMVWNEELKMEVPKEWLIYRLGDCFSFEKGKIPNELSSIQVNDNYYPYLTIDVVNGSLPEYCTKQKMPFCNGETIMVMDGAASGDVYIGNIGVLGSTFSMLIPKSIFSNTMIYWILKAYINVYKKSNTGSTVPHANRHFIENIKICMPPNINNFSIVFDNIQNKITANKEENRYLASLRDFLLPLLMNGQISFKA